MRAVVDIGSHSIKYTLEPERSNASSRSSQSRVIALGKNLSPGEPLSTEALSRLDGALQDFVPALVSAIGNIVVVGTAALRHCSNPEAAAALVQKHLHTKLHVIPGSREAQLSFLGARQDSPFLNPLCVDVGGASTEVGLSTGSLVHSVPWGALRVHESLLQSQCPVEILVWQNAQKLLDESFREEITPTLSAIDTSQVDGILAIGGSLMMTAKSLHPEQVTGKTVRTSLSKLRDFNDQVSQIDLNARIKKLGFSADRAEIGCAGLMCLFAATAWIPQSSPSDVVVTEGGLRTGVLLSWDDFAPKRIDSFPSDNC